MRRRISVAVLAVLVPLAGVPAAARAQVPDGDPPQRYVLHATLDPATHVVTGRERITFRNTSDAPLHTLVFHLYLNAFASRKTVFMKESGGQLRGVTFHGRGGIEVRSMRTAGGQDGGQDLLHRVHTDLVPHDATQMRVDLPAPVPPGGSLELEVRFRSELPPLFARSGYVRDFHVVAQWFPKLAKLEPDGTWASFPYHGNGEFYADFAAYDLTVVTPPDFVVAATGKRVEDRTEGGRRIRRFVARWVHDTVFVAWPHFRERVVRMGSVRVRFVYPPGYEPALARHVAITRDGLRRYGRLYGPYPYDVLTVVVPPRGTEGGAGMEYPTLFVTWGPWFTVPGLRFGMQQDVTAHELAHQWFQGLIATNEDRWPMLDEGLANWATWDLLGAVYGRQRSAMGPPWPSLDGFELLRAMAFFGPPTPPPATPASKFGAMGYARAIYGRVPVALETVARTWGRDRMLEALGRYARAQRFAHPGPEALYDAFDATYGAGFAKRVLRPAFDDGADAAVKVAKVEAERTKWGYRVRAVARRTGEVTVPTRLDLVGTGRPGALLRPDEDRTEVVYHGPDPVGAAVDEGHRILLDPSELDDARRPPALAVPEQGLWSRALIVLQSVLGWLGP